MIRIVYLMESIWAFGPCLCAAAKKSIGMKLSLSLDGLLTARTILLDIRSVSHCSHVIDVWRGGCLALEPPDHSWVVLALWWGGLVNTVCRMLHKNRRMVSDGFQMDEATCTCLEVSLSVPVMCSHTESLRDSPVMRMFPK